METVIVKFIKELNNHKKGALLEVHPNMRDVLEKAGFVETYKPTLVIETAEPINLDRIESTNEEVIVEDVKPIKKTKVKK